MDSTLIQQEVIDELAKAGGRGEPGEGDHRGGDERRIGLLRLLEEPRGAAERAIMRRSSSRR